MEQKEFERQMEKHILTSSVDIDRGDLALLNRIGKELNWEERELLVDLVIRLMGTYL